jgi:hypothetical protein
MARIGEIAAKMLLARDSKHKVMHMAPDGLEYDQMR